MHKSGLIGYRARGKKLALAFECLVDCRIGICDIVEKRVREGG